MAILTQTTTTTVTTATLFVPFQHPSGNCVSAVSLSDSRLRDDIFRAYFCARSNKRNTSSQVRFERNLSANLMSLYQEVKDRRYKPMRSMCFIIRDPVQREVFAAAFRDRIIHHYLYNKLEPLFEPAFIFDSYSCRKGKGTLFGIERLEHHIRSCTRNYHKKCYVLKLDLEGYFMNIDRSILYEMICSRIDKLRLTGSLPEGFDYDTVIYLLQKVVFLDPTAGCRIKGSLDDWKGLPDSKSLFKARKGCGLPIGNLTSQLFSNIYLNELDQFIKRELGFRHYGRYVDDSYLIHGSKEYLLASLPLIEDFLWSRLHLRLNHRKVKIYSVDDGVPFLGAVISPYGRALRRRNQRRITRNYLDTICYEADPYALLAVNNSYAGYLGHFNNLPHNLKDIETASSLSIGSAG